MPAKGKSRLTGEQKRKIAIGRVIGKRNKEIAKAAGVSVSTVEHVAKKPEIQTLIGRLKQKHAADIEKIFKGTVVGLKRDVLSTDPDIRHRAMSLGLKVTTAGDAPLARLEPGEGGEGQYTLEEILVTYRKVVSEP